LERVARGAADEHVPASAYDAPAHDFHALHPADFDRIEGIVPRLVAELHKALGEEVDRINQGRARSGGVRRG
jgi:hypothetical protein